MLFAAATHTAKAGTSIIGTVLHPIFVLVGYVLAFFYGLIPNYAVAIALLTIAVMIVVFPLTRASARSMMRMQLLAPEMKKIQARYKAKPGMPTLERQELRQKMNEEVMALYRENGVNPTGGCLPMFLRFPILIVLYDVVRVLPRPPTFLMPRVRRSTYTANCRSRQRRRTSPRQAGCTETSLRLMARCMSWVSISRIQCARISRMWSMSFPTRRSCHCRRPPVRVDLAGDESEPGHRGIKPADATDAEVHAAHLLGALSRCLQGSVSTSSFRVCSGSVSKSGCTSTTPQSCKAIQELTKRKHAEALNPGPDTADTRDATAGKGFLERIREASGNTRLSPAGGGSPAKQREEAAQNRTALEGAGQPERRQVCRSRKEAPVRRRPGLRARVAAQESEPRSRDKRPRKGR